MTIKTFTILRPKIFYSTPNVSIPNFQVEFFCYLLIDPKRLPNPTDALEGVASEAVPFSFRQFLSAIFYVGKGKRSRPLYHLVQAKKCRDLENNSKITGVVVGLVFDSIFLKLFIILIFLF